MAILGSGPPVRLLTPAGGEVSVSPELASRLVRRGYKRKGNEPTEHTTVAPAHPVVTERQAERVTEPRVAKPKPAKATTRRYSRKKG